jgi:type IV secretion system protein VirD4
MGTKFLAPMLFAAATKGLGMAEVLHWLDSREDQEVKDILAAAGVPAAVDAWESSQYRTDRAVDSLYATAEEVLHVYANERVAASTDGHDLDLEDFLSGDNTIYLYAPAHQQRLLRPLFETITQQVVAAAQEQAALAPDGMLSPRLGLFLDEAGNCAALFDLDVLATTARGQGIQLVTVWHDKSQLEARYGPKASTILNNHRAKLFLSGLADLSALELGARLIGDQALVERNRSMGSDGRHSLNESTSYRPLLPVEDLRRLRPGEGGCCCMGICGPLRSGCGPSTSRASRPAVIGPRTAKPAGWRGWSGGWVTGPNGPSSASSAAKTASRPGRRPRGWSGRSGKGAGDDPRPRRHQHPERRAGAAR